MRFTYRSMHIQFVTDRRKHSIGALSSSYSVRFERADARGGAVKGEYLMKNYFYGTLSFVGLLLVALLSFRTLQRARPGFWHCRKRSARGHDERRHGQHGLSRGQ